MAAAAKGRRSKSVDGLQALAVHVRDHLTYQHDKYCLDISPLTAELTHQIAHRLAMRSITEESREVLESFFGEP